ncbi:MAG TPA: nucleoside triphosphate pyrophosphohydrolase [Thermoleophilia bacterium]|nr:nucleoside triphosphate pyrophosphohydrolase [Thermoleophilia bacterium]
MGLTLVYIGAAAGAVPAASLRALVGGGAVFVPAGLDDELRVAIGEAADPGEGRLLEIDAADPAAIDEIMAAATAGPVSLALAGPQAPRLARALRASAAAASPALEIATVPAVPAFDDLLLGQELVSLKRIVDVLRVECPWDREQKAGDIVSYTLEETYELVDAVARDDLADVHGELGDLLLQVVILAMMQAEREAGDLGSITHDIVAKLIRRHPHIFADARADTAAEVKGRWEQIKREQEGREGVFHDVPAALPALLRAQKLQQRAAAVGFDWPSAAAAFPKIAEEHEELAELFAEAAGAGGTTAASSDIVATAETAVDPGTPDPSRRDPRVRHEVGDLLFAVVNVARLLHVDPELALREAADRFERRVTAAAAIAAAEGVEWTGVGLPEQEAYYQRAKALEAGGETAG